MAGESHGDRAPSPLSPEQQAHLKEYIALLEKHNRAIETPSMLSGAELRRLAQLRKALGDELVARHVAEKAVNGPIFPK